MNTAGEGLNAPYGALVDLARDIDAYDAADRIRSWRICPTPSAQLPGHIRLLAGRGGGAPLAALRSAASGSPWFHEYEPEAAGGVLVQDTRWRAVRHGRQARIVRPGPLDAWTTPMCD